MGVMAANMPAEFMLEQEINLDPIIADLDTTNQESIIYDTSRQREYADGGNFWISWGFDRFEALFDHENKTHRTSCQNSNTTIRGEWYPAGSRAKSWIIATPSGNKGFWATM